MSKESEQKILEIKQRYDLGQVQLANLDRRIILEADRINSVSTEDHKAPFRGVINAVFVSEGELIPSETPLVQVLDCAEPIAVVSVPEDRLGDYYIGQQAVVTPLDSAVNYDGKIQYISSGALISLDTTLAIESDLLQRGSKITIGFDPNEGERFESTCDTVRRANVSFKVKPLVDRVRSALSLSSM